MTLPRFPKAFAMLILTLPVMAASSLVGAEIPENFRTENLVAWCFVPFDAAKRTPKERANMLVDLGITRSAYDWRDEHVSSFEDEIIQYQENGIEYFAFWQGHDLAFRLFKKRKIQPQIWRMIQMPPNSAELSQSEKIEYAVEDLLPIVETARDIGSKVGLYNHGGWGGEPENMVAVAEALNRRTGAELVGIVYNFHHGHEHIDDFPAAFAVMKPHLICLNLNGMVSPERVEAEGMKILPIGTGTHESAMIRAVIESGYDGPIGILDHLDHVDAKVSLKRNIDGLANVVEAIRAAH